MIKPKVISVIPHEPNYEAYVMSKRPEINWDTQDGTWVGIWGYDWADEIAKEILNVSDEFEMEVWRPDFRAKKVYEHRFTRPNRTSYVHKVFPASQTVQRLGMKKVGELVSPEIIAAIKSEFKERSIIVHLHGNVVQLNQDILAVCEEIPVLNTFHGIIHMPKEYIFKWRKNITASYSYYKRSQQLKPLFTNVDYVTYMNNQNLNYLNELYSGEKIKLTMGCDFDYWKRGAKIIEAPIVFSHASRLIPIKQIDKLIEVFSQLDKERLSNFKLLICGNGETSYEKHLKALAQPLIDAGKIEFTGYLTGDEMLDIYHKSDVFMATSVSEGCSVAVVKAMACEVPVFSTKVGNTAEVMEDENCGLLVDTYDYDAWKAALKTILKGEEIEALPHDKARDYYSWETIARKFLMIYQQLNAKYYDS